MPKRLLPCGLCSSVCNMVLFLGDFERKTSCLPEFAKYAMLCSEGGRGAPCLFLRHGSRELEGDHERAIPALRLRGRKRSSRSSLITHSVHYQLGLNCEPSPPKKVFLSDDRDNY